jgi:hypothetical protein
MRYATMKWIRIAGSSLTLSVSVLVACAGPSPTGGFQIDPASTGSSTGGGGSGGGGPGGGSGGAGSGGAEPVDGGYGAFGAAGGSGLDGCRYADSTDHDGDGFSGIGGDCNDCDPNTNPGAFDVPANGIDEDCNGTPDDEPTGCDTQAVLASTDPYNAALAMDLCRKTSETATGKQRTWGVVAAAYIAPDGSDTCGNACTSNSDYALGHGNLTHLGKNTPQNSGTHMHALSSGTARDPSDPGYQDVSGFDKLYIVAPAPGFPAPAPACPGVVTGQPHDGAALRLVLRVPTNAQSFTFNSNFFSYEFPDYICSEYNDAFVVEMAPAPAGAGTGGNVVFDQAGNPISVNNALLQACSAQTAGGKKFSCPLGPSSLEETGFGQDVAGVNHAATGWLQTQVNIDPSLKGKDVTLVFAVWDSGDGVLDSTALIDNFQWSTQPGQNAPVTQPAQ